MASMLFAPRLQVRGDARMVGTHACQWALTRVFWGGGALEVGDLRFLEDGDERNGSLVSDAVRTETASEGRRGRGERVSMSTGIDKMANTQGPVRAMGGVLQVHQRRIVFDALRESGSSFGTEGIVPETANTVRTEAVLRGVNWR